MKKRLAQILFWSVISAAFVGPGTVTTAASAGASFQTALVWALIFSVLACILLQEAASRVTIVSGKSLGEAILTQYKSKRNADIVRFLLAFSVVFGCAAYEAGNILGAISGVALLIGLNTKVLATILVLLASLLLWKGNYRLIANALGVIVALMGLAFIIVAMNSTLSIGELVNGLKPSIPKGSSLLVLSLVGTTVVPYNLFLGSGISKGADLKESRFGLVVSIGLGGVFSLAILMSGTLVSGTFSFEGLSYILSGQFGEWASILFGFGLFAAGFTSTITAPLASLITVKSLYGNSDNNNSFRWVWMAVLLVGWLFGILDVKPIPMIILAQAINGFLLPIAATFLILAVNDKKLVPNPYSNSLVLNILSFVALEVTVLIGLINLIKAAYQLINKPFTQSVLPLIVVLSLLITGFTFIKVWKMNTRSV